MDSPDDGNGVSASSPLHAIASQLPAHPHSHTHTLAPTHAHTDTYTQPHTQPYPHTNTQSSAPAHTRAHGPDVQLKVVDESEHISALHRQYTQTHTHDLASLFNAQFYVNQLVAVLMHEDENHHFGVVIRLEDLMHACPSLGSLLGRESQHVIMTLENAMRAAEERILTGPLDNPDRDKMIFKYHVHARIAHLFSLPGYVRPNISAIRSSDMGRFVQVSGTVIRTGVIRMVERVRFFKCTHQKCGYEFPVYIEVEHDNTIELPRACPNPSLPNGKRCTGSSFKPVEGRSVNADYQEIKVQEPVSSLAVGSIPRSIVVVLENDLVDAVKAGDDVVITGTVIHRWGRVSRGARCDLDLLLRANHVRVSSTSGLTGSVTDQLLKDFRHFWAYYGARPLLGRNAIVRSICPQLHGLYMVKLAVAMVLVGGVGQVHPNGTKTRGESHLLLIGDPGTGKSQFLRYASKVIPRSVLTTGIGTTSAGLTCTAVKDSGEWMLEAGALVLADRGLCCIDEFSSIRDHDRTAIHEAMEQQTLSVAKAGLVCKLNSRCTIIAATNPKGKYDQNIDVSANTAIASPLLSRFDLILVLLDTNNPSWDSVVSSFIVAQACSRGEDLLATSDMRTRPLREAMTRIAPASADGIVSQSSAFSAAASTAATSRAPAPASRGGVVELASDASGVTPDGGRVEDMPGQQVVWSLERVQAYLQHVKAAYAPTLSKTAQEVLMRYYELQRRTDSRSAARTTLRLLESLVRLAQAHARLCCRHEAGVQDAVIAVLLVETSMHASAMLTVTPVLHASFPEDPDAEYAKQEVLVLRRLGLAHLAGGGGSGTSGPATSDHSASAAAADLALMSMFGAELQDDANIPARASQTTTTNSRSTTDTLALPRAAQAAEAPASAPSASNWYADAAFDATPQGYVRAGDTRFRPTSMPLMPARPALGDARNHAARAQQPPLEPQLAGSKRSRAIPDDDGELGLTAMTVVTDTPHGRFNGGQPAMVATPAASLRASNNESELSRSRVDPTAAGAAQQPSGRPLAVPGRGSVHDGPGPNDCSDANVGVISATAATAVSRASTAPAAASVQMLRALPPPATASATHACSLEEMLDLEE